MRKKSEETIEIPVNLARLLVAEREDLKDATQQYPNYIYKS